MKVEPKIDGDDSKGIKEVSIFASAKYRICPKGKPENNVNMKAIDLATARDMLFDLFNRGVTVVTETCSEVLNDIISDERIEAFDQGIEIGVENTIRALIDASVHEDKMITAIQKSWGLSREDSAQKIGSVKRKIALEGLEEYLLCKGKSKFAVNKFKQEYSVIIRLNHDESLIGLWDKPEKLYAKLLDWVPLKSRT